MPRQCASVKSKHNTSERCPNQAKPSQEFCGIHGKIGASVIRWKDSNAIDYGSPVVLAAASKIKKWWSCKNPSRQINLHGPAFYNRSICVNEEDFFNSDSLKDISGFQFFSYRDISDNLFYGFDIRSFNMLLQKASEKGEAPQNPYTRSVIPSQVGKKALTLVKWLSARKLETSWDSSSIELTPDQLWRMRVVELFVLMEELQYGADPEWFISLNLRKQKEFYLNLLDIWSHRASLTHADRARIVPTGDVLFHWGPARIAGIQLIGTIRSTNTAIIKRLISSAVEKSDRVLGAMYVLTALTQVSPQAAEAFPWLYETAMEAVPYHQQWIQ